MLLPSPYAVCLITRTCLTNQDCQVSWRAALISVQFCLPLVIQLSLLILLYETDPRSAIHVRLLEVALSSSTLTIIVFVIFLLPSEVHLVLCCNYCFTFFLNRQINFTSYCNCVILHFASHTNSLCMLDNENRSAQTAS